MKSSSRIAVLLFCVSTLAFAGDHEFSGLVSSIESHYGVHHTHIPLLGFALFFARPAGVSGVKLAIFEDLPPSSHLASAEDVRDVVEHSLEPGWHLFVRSESRVDKETTLIYANLLHHKMQMLIVNIEPDEATVVKMKLSEGAMRRWIREPKESAESRHSRHPAED